MKHSLDSLQQVCADGDTSVTVDMLPLKHIVYQIFKGETGSDYGQWQRMWQSVNCTLKVKLEYTFHIPVLDSMTGFGMNV